MPEIEPPPFETFVQVFAWDPKILVTSRHYGKSVFYLAMEAAAQEMVDKGLVVGSKHVPLEALKKLGT